MSKLSQKDAVIQEVLSQIPSFVKNTDVALNMLTATQLETIKSNITSMILNGLVDYSKDLTQTSEVRTYARSMVMNHIKKAKELNGGQGLKPTASGQPMVRVKSEYPKGVDGDLLPEDLKEFAKSIR